jgi:hypothetical protein
MPNIQHSTLPSASVHEPKHITINGPAASGKVITNSSSVVATSEYRNLDASEIVGIQDDLMVLEIDGTIAQTHYIPATFSGTVDALTGIVNTAVAGGSNTYEVQIDGVTVTGTPITLDTTPGTGGTAGDFVSAPASASNEFSAGQVITIVNTAQNNTEADLNIRFVITVTRT